VRGTGGQILWDEQHLDFHKISDKKNWFNHLGKYHLLFATYEILETPKNLVTLPKCAKKHSLIR
jgi:hypothetical protein